MMRLHTKALALSAGIVVGGSVFIITLAGVFFGYGEVFLQLLESIYPGYSISLVGSAIGLVYGFLDGALCAGLIGYVYNKTFVRM